MIPFFRRPRSKSDPPDISRRPAWRENTGAAPDRYGLFREAFKQAGVPYFNPHSLRNTIVAFGSQKNLTWQEMQAWAQNLGHKSLTTTFGSYGQVAPHQQGDLVRNAGRARGIQDGDMHQLMAMVSDIHAKAKGSAS
jgi:integrase